MSSEMQPSQSFEERMKDDIRGRIGDLLTDEDLAKLVNRACEDLFFNTRSVHGGRQEQRFPPLMHEIVRELLYDAAAKEVSAWMQEHADEIIPIMREQLGRDADQMIRNALNRSLEDLFRQFQVQIEDRIRNGCIGQF